MLTWGITKVIRLNTPGVMNVCAIFHDYPSSSCSDVSVWRKRWQHCHSLHESSINENKWSRRYPIFDSLSLSFYCNTERYLPPPSPPPVIHGWASGLRMSLPFAMEGYSHSVSVISLRFAWHWQNCGSAHRRQVSGSRSDTFPCEEQQHKNIPSDPLWTWCASHLRSHAHTAQCMQDYKHQVYPRL